MLFSGGEKSQVRDEQLDIFERRLFVFPGRRAERPGRYRATAMLYDVLVVSNGGGGKRFTTAIGAAARTQVQVAFRAREVTALLLLSLDWRAQGERRSI